MHVWNVEEKTSECNRDASSLSSLTIVNSVHKRLPTDPLTSSQAAQQESECITKRRKGHHAETRERTRENGG